MNVYKEIERKQTILRGLYGGMMTMTEVKRELGLASDTSVREALREVEIPASKIGRRKMYETDLLAKRLVEVRGMV